MPTYVLTEFTKLTSGLLSNFALKSLTELRQNSHRILSLFSKDLDVAYLGHQSLLPNTRDANELLVELLKDIFSSILRYKNINTLIDSETINLWIDGNIEEKEKPILKPDGTDSSDKKYIRNKQLLKDLLIDSNDVEKKFKEKLGSSFSNKEINGYIRNNNITLFSDSSIADNLKYYEQFARLSHHKSLIASSLYTPTLSLGSVIKSTLGSYFVCIQQRCDSLRMEKYEKRRFLFITLEKVLINRSFDFVTPEGEKLKVNNKTHSLRTIKFDGSGKDAVYAKKVGVKYYFYPSYFKSCKGERFEWLFDLKDLHAQRIVTKYCADLSRVGLDESEWLRQEQH